MTRSNFCAGLAPLNIVAMPASAVWALVALIALAVQPVKANAPRSDYPKNRAGGLAPKDGVAVEARR